MSSIYGNRLPRLALHIPESDTVVLTQLSAD